MTRIDPAELARLVEKIAELLPKVTPGKWRSRFAKVQTHHYIEYGDPDLGSIATVSIWDNGNGPDKNEAAHNAALIALAPTMAAAIAGLVAERGPLVCTGCGSVQTIEQIRAEHPRALSCCPERQMVPQAEARLREIERERDGEREAREKCDRALRMKDEAVGELLHRLHKAGVDCSDLIP